MIYYVDSVKTLYRIQEVLDCEWKVKRYIDSFGRTSYSIQFDMDEVQFMQKANGKFYLRPRGFYFSIYMNKMNVHVNSVDTDYGLKYNIEIYDEHGSLVKSFETYKFNDTVIKILYWEDLNKIDLHWAEDDKLDALGVMEISNEEAD